MLNVLMTKTIFSCYTLVQTSIKLNFLSLCDFFLLGSLSICSVNKSAVQLFNRKHHEPVFCVGGTSVDSPLTLQLHDAKFKPVVQMESFCVCSPLFLDRYPVRNRTSCLNPKTYESFTLQQN